MAVAKTPTLLSLDRYARIMGLNPAHFNGAYGPSGSDAPMPLNQSCSAIWRQYPWQDNDKVSREELAQTIASAEQEIAEVLHYWPAPAWMCEEVVQYPKYHRPDSFGETTNVQGLPCSVTTKYAKVIAGGRRAVELLATATTAGGTMVFSDPDADGWDELVTITVPTVLTNACEIKVYYAGYSGEPEWEIRDPISKVITGANVVIKFYAWQLINPANWEILIHDTTELTLNLNNAIYVASVEIYREYNNETLDSAEFYWEPTAGLMPLEVCSICSGAGCPACTYTTQLGCMHVRDTHAGIVVPMIGTYDCVNGWISGTWSHDRRPDFVKLWYYSGEIDNRKLCSRACDPLSDKWANVIALLATARLRRPLCGCGAAQERMTNLQRDAMFSATGDFFNATAEELSNPFGTKVGEIMAWRLVKQNPRRLGVALT
jgi:hypothetical protein